MFDSVVDALGIAEVARCGGHHDDDDEHHDDGAGHVVGVVDEGIPTKEYACPPCALAGGLCDCCCGIWDIAWYALD